MAPPARIGVVTGSPAEADCLAPLIAKLPAAQRPLVALGGPTDPTEAAAARLLEQGVAGLLSIGLAAGLHPVAAAGEVFHATGVRILRVDQPPIPMVARRSEKDFERIPADPEWLGAIIDGYFAATREKIGGFLPWQRDIAGSDHAAATGLDKAYLFEETAGYTADTQSHVVARAAKSAGLPFAAIRAVDAPVLPPPSPWPFLRRRRHRRRALGMLCYRVWECGRAVFLPPALGPGGPF